MSLLNDALKKKQREEQLPVGFPGGTSRSPTPSRARLYTLLGVVAIAAAGIAFMLIFFPSSAPPVRRIRQIDNTAAPGTPAAVATTPAPAPVASTTVVAVVPAAAVRPATRTVAKPALPKRSLAAAATAAPPVARETAAAPPTTGEMPAPVAPPSPPRQVELTDELDPALQPYYEKAQSYQKQKRYSEAATFYRQILQQSPRHRGSRRNLTTCLLESGRYREAYDLALPLSQEQPDEAIIWLNLAIAEIGINENQQALLHLREAEMKHGPRYEIFLNRGVAASHLGQWEEAFAAYRDAEAVSPGDAALLFNLGLASDKTGKLTDAARYYEKFLQNTEPAHPKRQQVDDRLQVIRRYLAAQPSNARP
jgi:Flp pilus assembly protein TadD